MVELVDTNTMMIVATTTTDLNGAYLFTALPPSGYHVNVVDATVPLGFSIGMNFSDPSAGRMLDSGEGISGIGFGYLNDNTNTAVLGDFVWSDADGGGVQDPGEPGIGDVEVTLFDLGPDGFFGTTDDLVAGVTTNPAEWVLSLFRGDSNRLRHRGDGWSGVPRGQMDPYLATIVGGAFIEYADFGYGPSPGTIGNQVFVDTNNDGIFNVADGDYGLVDITLQLQDTNGMLLTTAQTDWNGRYFFAGLPAGAYIVFRSMTQLFPRVWFRECWG